MLKSNFKNLINYLQNKKIVITTHNFVDIDGLTSCFALKYFINEYLSLKEVSVYFSEFSRSARDFLDKMIQKFPDFDFSYSKMEEISESEVMIILDANDPKLTNYSGEFSIPFIFIDHHAASDENIDGNLSSYNIILENFTSTAEIIYELYDSYDEKLSKTITWLLLCGLLVDSGVFKHGNNNTIRRASKILNDDVELQEMYPLLRRDIEISEKKAKIKGMQRVEIIQAGEFLIGASHVSAYEANVASTLLNVGFDVTIVLAQKKKEFRISTRARKDLCIKTGLHLGKILDEVAKLHDGVGGGHDGAAGMTGKKDHEVVLEQIIEKVKRILKKEK